MRKGSFDEKLAKLQEIAGAQLTDEAVETLRAALNGSHGVLAATAAEIAGTRRIADLEPDLVRAFNRFMVETDKTCQVKIAAVEALDRLAHMEDDVYLRGIKHVQMEPAYGGMVDVAADLRAACAVALAQMRHPRTAFELTTLLVDPEVNPRRAAVKALAYMGGPEAELVLRFKALVGDDDRDVMGLCFSGLMEIAPDESMDFVARFLENENIEIAEQAAIALGQSHEGKAFELMKEHWENNLDPQFRRMLLLPISLLRRDDAFEFLIEVVGSTGPRTAVEAVRSLAIFQDETSVKKVRDAVKKRNDPEVTEAFTREFRGNT